MFAWTSLDGTRHLAIGTDRKLYIYKEGEIADVTPIRASGTGNITGIQTTNGSTTIIVTDVDHGAFVGDFVTIDTMSEAVGGISAANMEGEFEILSVPSSDTYTITAKAAASSDETDNSLTANAAYQVNVGTTSNVYGYGWGTSAWNGLSTSGRVTTTINEGGIFTNSDTTLTVTSGTGFTANAYILIDQEILRISSVSTN